MGGRGSLTIFRVRGIPVRLHFTFLIILPYLAYVIARTTPMLARMADVEAAALSLPPLLMGGLLALGLFACVLLHELAHVFVGLRGGARVGGITLMLVGGVSEVTELPRRPSLEALMAIAGPAMSLVLAGVSYAGFRLSGGPDLAFALYYLAYVNLALAIFNLVPAFPMDGGRVLRAVLSMFSRRVTATRIAAYVGQGMAALFLVGAVLTFNWVLLLVGLLVVAGARAELEMVKSVAALEGLTVNDAMRRFPPTVDVHDPLSLVLERMRRELKTTYFVLARGQMVGAITADDAQRGLHTDAGIGRVEDVMLREIPALAPAQDLASAVTLLRASPLTMLPVITDDGLVGSISAGSVGAALRAREAPRGDPVARWREREGW